MDKMLTTRESVSALADGDLHGEAFAQAVEATLNDPDARATWHAYHLVGDALRSQELTKCCVRDGFMGRLQARLQAETMLPPTVAAPVQPPLAVELPARAAVVAEAANASVFRWKMLAGVASVMAVGAMAWTVVGTGGRTGDAPVLAAVPLVQPVTSLVQPATSLAQAATPMMRVAEEGGSALGQAQPPVMIRDPHLDALLAAHKQFGGTSALQAPAGFLRNATFEGSGR